MGGSKAQRNCWLRRPSPSPVPACVLPTPASAFLYCNHGKSRHSSLSHQETGVPKIQAISNLSDDSDLELDASSLSMLDGTPTDTTDVLSHVFALSRGLSKTAWVPFADICKPTATTELETQGQDAGTTSARPLIQELEEGESNQSLLTQTCASDPALAQSSEDGDSQLTAATLLGNTQEAMQGGEL